MKAVALLALLAYLGTAQAASPMGKSEYRAERTRIQDQYATAKDRCASADGHAREVCETEARTSYQAARAELRARFRPDAGHRDKAAMAAIDARFDLALAKCGDLKDSALSICRAEAKAQWKQARAEAKAERVAKRRGLYAPDTLNQRLQSRETQADAGFAAERERCSALDGQAREFCMANARKAYAR